jgi:hypothetical protein
MPGAGAAIGAAAMNAHPGNRRRHRELTQKQRLRRGGSPGRLVAPGSAAAAHTWCPGRAGAPRAGRRSGPADEIIGVGLRLYDPLVRVVHAVFDPLPLRVGDRRLLGRKVELDLLLGIIRA